MWKGADFLLNGKKIYNLPTIFLLSKRSFPHNIRFGKILMVMMIMLIGAWGVKAREEEGQP